VASKVKSVAQARHSAGLAAEQAPQSVPVHLVLQPSAEVVWAVVAVKAVVSASLPIPPVHQEQVPVMAALVAT